MEGKLWAFSVSSAALTAHFLLKHAVQTGRTTAVSYLCRGPAFVSIIMLIPDPHLLDFTVSELIQNLSGTEDAIIGFFTLQH